MTAEPLAFWTADQFSSVIGQLTALVLGLTGLLAGVTALYRTSGLKRDVKEAKVDSAHANQKSDIANERAGNNAQAITGVRQTLDQVTLQTSPVPAIKPVEFPSAAGPER